MKTDRALTTLMIGDGDARADILAREKSYAQHLQRQGKWRHLWRVVGKYSNISIFDVDSADELHNLLWELPLFSYMTVEVTPLTAHPSAIAASAPPDSPCRS